MGRVAHTWGRATFVAAAIAGALVAAAAVPALANDSSIGGSVGAAHPITQADIRMQAETVQALCFSRFAQYQVDFQFTNSGTPRMVKLGFPFPPEPGEGDYTPPAAFRAWQDGKPLSVTVEKGTDGGNPVQYYVHTARFPTGGTRIRVSYLAVPDSSVVGESANGLRPPVRYAGSMSLLDYYPYTVHTGAGWAGTIGRSIIRYTLTPSFLGWGQAPATTETVSRAEQWGKPPADWADDMRASTQPEPGVYQWTFSDFEPKVAPGQTGSAYDIGLAYYQPVWPSDKPPAWEPVARVTGSSELKLDGYQYPAVQAADGNPSTAWAEAAKGSGTGQWIKVEFGSRRPVREILVLAGYAKTAALFAKYNRPKTLGVEFSDGTKTRLDLEDLPSLQRFPVSAVASWAKLTIGEVYRGTTRDEAYLSEIEFAPAPAQKFQTFAALMGASTGGTGAGGDGSGTASGTAGSGPTSSTGTSGSGSGSPRPGGCAIPSGLVLAGLLGLLVGVPQRRRARG
jgi:hypothetical protein